MEEEIQVKSKLNARCKVDIFVQLCLEECALRLGFNYSSSDSIMLQSQDMLFQRVHANTGNKHGTRKHLFCTPKHIYSTRKHSFCTPRHITDCIQTSILHTKAFYIAHVKHLYCTPRYIIMVELSLEFTRLNNGPKARYYGPVSRRFWYQYTTTSGVSSTPPGSILFYLRGKRQFNTTFFWHASKRYHADSNFMTWQELSHRFLPLCHRY